MSLLRAARWTEIGGMLGAGIALGLASGLAGADPPAGSGPPLPAVPASVAQPPLVLPEVVIAAPEPRYVAPTLRDRIGRIWAPVLIDGRGPFRLVLDTGASSSAITRQVAETLELPIAEGSVRLRGVTGTAIVDGVRVQRLEVGELIVGGMTLPIVADAFGGAQGVLGAAGLDDKRITIGFRADRITIARSHNQVAPPGWMTVPFRYSRKNGMRATIRIGTVTATALIDTGAQLSVGNLALREALKRRPARDDELTEAIIGVTEDIQLGTRVRIPAITAGDMIVRGAHIVFSDLHIFEHWRLADEPTLLVGMDIIGVLDTLVIDYRRRELQIKPR